MLSNCTVETNGILIGDNYKERETAVAQLIAEADIRWARHELLPTLIFFIYPITCLHIRHLQPSLVSPSVQFIYPQLRCGGASFHYFSITYAKIINTRLSLRFSVYIYTKISFKSPVSSQHSTNCSIFRRYISPTVSTPDHYWTIIINWKNIIIKKKK